MAHDSLTFPRQPGTVPGWYHLPVVIPLREWHPVTQYLTLVGTGPDDRWRVRLVPSAST